MQRSPALLRCPSSSRINVRTALVPTTTSRGGPASSSSSPVVSSRPRPQHRCRAQPQQLEVAQPTPNQPTLAALTAANGTLSAAGSLPQTNGAGPPPDDNDAEILIEFRDVYKSFGDKKILNGATFKIRRGEAVGIIGASGTGKSTTLRLAAGLLAADSGQVLIRGQARVGLLSDDPGSTPSAKKASKKSGGAAGAGDAASSELRIGMVFQNAALFDSLSVGENVGFLLYEHSDLPAHVVRERVADSLAKVGLRGVEDLAPSELSGGMRKRVALARAVVSDVTMSAGVEQVIMYDEPTAGLDPVASTVVEDLMRSLQSGNKGGISSYIVVTHQHSTIRRAVDRIIFLHQGKVVWEGPTAEFDTTDEPIVRQFAQGSLEGPISYV